MSNQTPLPPLPTGSSDSPELTEAEIQAIFDNLAIPENMSQQATTQAQESLHQGDALLDAMHGGGVDLSAGGPGPDASGEIGARQTGLDVTPDIVELRRQLARELFPDGDPSPAWESASPGQTAPPPVADPTAETTAPPPTPGPDPAPIPYIPSTPIPAPIPDPQSLLPDPQSPFPDAGGYSSYRVLQTEIAALYGEVREVLAPEQSASKQARALLSEASIMLKGQPEDLDVVEAKVRQVREILRQAQASQQNADTYGRPILIYLSAWLLLSLGAIIYFYLDSSLLSQGLGRHANALVITLFWGAIGGILSATHSLWWHTSEAQDYDHRFNASYVVRPVVGMILGGLIYAIIALAFDTFSLDLPGNLLLGLIPSLLALIAGFRSGQLLRLVGFSPNVT